MICAADPLPGGVRSAVCNTKPGRVKPLWAPPGLLLEALRPSPARRDRFTEIPGVAGGDLVEVRREAWVGHVQRAELAVHLRRARVEPAVDQQAVLLDGRLHRLVVRRGPGAHPLDEPF